MQGAMSNSPIKESKVQNTFFSNRSHNTAKWICKNQKKKNEVILGLTLEKKFSFSICTKHTAHNKKKL